MGENYYYIITIWNSNFIYTNTKYISKFKKKNVQIELYYYYYANGLVHNVMIFKV